MSHGATNMEFDHGAKELSDMPPALVENSNETHYCESATNMDIGPYNYVLELENKEMTHLLWNHTQSMDVYLQSKDGSTLRAHKCVLASQSRFINDVLTIMLDYEEEDLEMILRIMYGYTRG